MPRGLKRNEVKGLKRTDDPRIEKFCQLYASDAEFFANGTQSYIEAFNVEIYKGKKPKEKKGVKYMTYDSVRDTVSNLLTDSHILKRIDDIFVSRGLNDTFVDKKLEFWLTETAHPPQSLEAIKEYNKLKKRISDRLEVNMTHHELSDEEIDRLLQEQEKFFKKR